MANCRSRSWIVLRFSASILGIGLAGFPGSQTADAASAKDRQGGEDKTVATRPATTPVMAIVSLNQQRVTIYDQEGPVLQAPVSTGQSGYETPAGIYSVLEKQAEHYSNLYDDASMPFMQRLTWSGIALHAGVLPGRPASHGCIRMPLGFAEQLFERTKLGMRVIVVRDDITPAELAHPALFKPLSADVAAAAPGTAPEAARDGASAAPAETGSTRIASAAASALPAGPRRSLRAIATAKTAAAAAATAKAEETRMAARGATIEAARATKAIRRAEGLKGRAELQLRQAEQTASAASTGAATERTQQAKAAAQAAFAAADAQLNLVKSEMQPKVDQALQLRQQAKEVQEASQAAQEEAKEAARKLSPVSVFISRATQRLYVRQAREPILEASVTIADADRPLGTYVFTALAYTSGEDDLRWNVVSMYRTRNEGRQGGSKHQDNGARHAGSNAADLAGAKLALTRVAIPKEAAERISEVVGPGSSLIISDEAMSRETGKATEFIVLMSNEPQGGIKIRRRSLEAGNRYQRPAYGGGPFGWGGSGRGGFLWW